MDPHSAKAGQAPCAARSRPRTRGDHRQMLPPLPGTRTRHRVEHLHQQATFQACRWHDGTTRRFSARGSRDGVHVKRPTLAKQFRAGIARNAPTRTAPRSMTSEPSSTELCQHLAPTARLPVTNARADSTRNRERRLIRPCAQATPLVTSRADNGARIQWGNHASQQIDHCNSAGRPGRRDSFHAE